MSHAPCLVVLDGSLKRSEVEQAIAEQMEPFSEEGKGWFGDGSRWDWYQVGGRFTGLLDGYDPKKDPRNVETCNLCAGTGKRKDMVVVHGCNGCSGKGRQTKWPTQWAKHDGDVLRKRDIPKGHELPGIALLKNREWHEGGRMGWFGCKATAEGGAQEGEPSVVVMTDKRGVGQAKVVNYGLSDDAWREKIMPGLLADVPKDAWLAVVDYHV